MHRLHGLLLLLLLGACATPKAPVVLRHEQATASSFAFNGRVAVRHQGERTSAGVHWTHHGSSQDEILLLAPLGQTVARIFSNSEGVLLEASGKQYFDRDAESLTEQVLGWHLPLSGMRYWVLALPAAGSEAVIERSESGQVKVLRQDGWEINYTRYATEAADSLPLRMTLQRADMEMQLLIDEWEI